MFPKFIKYGLTVFGGLFTVFGLLLIVIALVVNPNDYKPEIVKLVQEKKQRTLLIAGDIKLRLFPRIGLDLGKTRLSEHKGTQEFAALDSVQLYVAWLPLLRKELVVYKVSIAGAHANLVRNVDGTTNFDDLIDPEEPSAQIKFDIDSVKVSRSTLNFDDRLAQRKFAISELALRTGRIRDNTPTDIKLNFNLALDQPKLAVQVMVNSGLLFALQEKHFVLGDLDLKMTGAAAGISQLDLRAQGDIDIQRNPQAIVLSGIKLSIKGKHVADQIELALDAPKLRLTPDKVESAKLMLDAKIDQPQAKLTAQLILPDVMGNTQQVQTSQMTFNMESRQGNSRIKVQLTSPMRGDLEAQTFNLAKLNANFEVINPALVNGNIKLALTGDAHGDVAQQEISANLQSKLDNSAIRAKLGMRQFANPHYNFDIVIDQLDIDRYLSPKPKVAKNVPESPLDFSGLKTIQAIGSIKIGTLKFAGTKSSNVRLDVK